jgi:hypothetical protein
MLTHRDDNRRSSGGVTLITAGQRLDCDKALRACRARTAMTVSSPTLGTCIAYWLGATRTRRARHLADASDSSSRCGRATSSVAQPLGWSMERQALVLLSRRQTVPADHLRPSRPGARARTTDSWSWATAKRPRPEGPRTLPSVTGGTQEIHPGPREGLVSGGSAPGGPRPPLGSGPTEPARGRPWRGIACPRQRQRPSTQGVREVALIASGVTQRR